MKVLTAFLLLLLCACAKPEAATPQSSLTIRKIWVSNSDPNWIMDLTTHNRIHWTYGTGGECQSTVLISWTLDENYGRMEVSNSFALVTVPGMPPCTQFDSIWDYYLLGDGRLMINNESFDAPVVFR